MSKTKREWCAMLARLVAPMQAPDAAAAFVAMLPMLPDDDAAFNRDTLDAAARRDPGDTAVPNYDKLNRVFATWRREKLPVRQRMGANPEVPQIVAPPREVSAAEIDYVNNLVAALKEESAQRRQCHDGRARPAENAPEPKFLNKLQIARSMPREKAMARPDLRAALEDAEQVGRSHRSTSLDVGDSNNFPSHAAE